MAGAALAARIAIASSSRRCVGGILNRDGKKIRDVSLVGARSERLVCKLCLRRQVSNDRCGHLSWRIEERQLSRRRSYLVTHGFDREFHLQLDSCGGMFPVQA